ncbi:hypothetical protein ACHWQZ_G001322 [Mnemiopsis leidyi]
MVLHPSGSKLPAVKKTPVGGTRKRDSYPSQEDLASPWKAEGTQSRLSRKGSSKSESDTGSTKSTPHSTSDKQTNLDYEAALVHQKIKNVSECCNLLRHSNFKELSERMSTLSEFDRHLQHLLLSENSLKGLDCEIRKLTDLIASSKSASESFNNSTLESINLNITELQRDVDSLAREPRAAPSISEPTYKLLNEINLKLEQLHTNESRVSADIAQLKVSLQGSPKPYKLP